MIRDSFLRFKSSKLAHNSAWMLGGNGLKLAIQLAYFVIIARSLEPEQYGAFVAVVALTAILAPFVGLGTSNLLIKNVARDPNCFPASWGNALLVTVVTGIAAFLVVVACRFMLPANIHWTVLLFIASADLICGRLSDLCGFAFSAVERFGATAQINVWISLTRLIGLGGIALVVRHPTVAMWAYVYLAASLVTALASLVWAGKALGRASLDTGQLREELSDGFFFSVGQSAQSIYNDIDKTMLAKLGSLSATGIYGAAYRIIDVTLVPIRSVLSAAYPGFFRAGQNGMAGSLGHMKRMLPKAVIYSIVILLGLLVCAPLVPRILGSEYARTVEALRWLAFLPVLKAIHLFLADALTGAGFQRLRTLLQVGVAGFNVLLNLWIIPAYSWRGAAWSSIASDALLASVLGFAITVISRGQKAARQRAEEEQTV